MIRILFDEAGDSHNDIQFKVDGIPTFNQVVDSYYIADFLNITKELPKSELIINFIEYVKIRIEKLPEREQFIPIDLSDQYVGGILVKKSKKDFLQVKYGFTQKYRGWEINTATIEKILVEEFNLEVEREWLLTRPGIEEGLKWSVDRILKLRANSEI